MSDLLERASSWLADQRAKFASRLVTYHRKAGDRVVVNACLGSSQFEAENNQGLIERYESRDFLVKAPELVIDGQQFLPQRGDRIVDDRTGMTYEVLEAGGECWRYSDPNRISLRIHTKLVATDHSEL